MHTLIDARLILAQMTGVGRYLLGLARGFGQLPGEDTFEFWLQAGLPRTHPAWSLENRQVHLRPVALPHMSLRAQWALPAQLARTRYDVLHYPHFDLPFFTGGPLVVTLHDLKYITRPDFFSFAGRPLGRTRRLVMLVMMRSAVQKARRVIVVSESTRQDAIRRLKAPADKLRVVSHGVEEAYFRPLPAAQIQAVRRRYGLELPFVFFLGERRPHKNIPGLLRAFALFQRMTDQPYRLAIAGKPYAEYRYPERLAEELGLAQAVRFIDDLPDADLPALYQSASAFALLSYYEGFGMPLLEAMAGGAPVLAANTTSLPEVVGQAGLCVSPDDPEAAAQALRQLVEGGEKHAACIAAGLQHARQFTWERCASQTHAIYQEITHTGQ